MRLSALGSKLSNITKNHIDTMDNTLILHLPFSDPDGSTKAYDYSQSRADATLSGGAQLEKDSDAGKVLSLNGTGEAITTKAIPVSSSFTLSLNVRTDSDMIGWVLNSPGVNNFIEKWIQVTPNQREALVFVKSANVLTVYLNKNVVYLGTIPGTPNGFALCDPNIMGTNAKVDNVQLFNRALSEKEILAIQSTNDDVEYYIDDLNFKEFGVEVSKSSGLFDRLARKEALTVDWDNYHGIVRDKKRPRYKERKITLECFIYASSRTAFVEWVQRFFAQFDAAGNHRLKCVPYLKTKPLVYEVELLDEVDVDKTWGQYNDDLMVGTFKIVLVEDEPVKRVLRHIGTTANTVASVTVTSVKYLNIAWGDGTHTYNVAGTNKTVQHTYAKPGEYDIVISGVIEDIEAFSTNAIVIWDLLK